MSCLVYVSFWKWIDESGNGWRKLTVRELDDLLKPLMLKLSKFMPYLMPFPLTRFAIL